MVKELQRLQTGIISCWVPTCVGTYTAASRCSVSKCLQKQDKLLQVVPPSLWHIGRGVKRLAICAHQRLWLHLFHFLFLGFGQDKDQLRGVALVSLEQLQEEFAGRLDRVGVRISERTHRHLEQVMRRPRVDHREGAAGRHVVVILFNLEGGLAYLVVLHLTLLQLAKLHRHRLLWIGQPMCGKHVVACAEQVVRERLKH
mmetsp:Transcript_17080/g.25716  ORF Transcript_17080/g.25716 Transcript_17080/m.25716 type:complete len:200 (+) Transcript_17080:116-715(+)